MPTPREKINDALASAEDAPALPTAKRWVEETTLWRSRVGLGKRSEELQVLDRAVERLDNALKALARGNGAAQDLENEVVDALVELKEAKNAWLEPKDYRTARLNEALFTELETLDRLIGHVADLDFEDPALDPAQLEMLQTGRSRLLANLALSSAMKSYGAAEDPAFEEFQRMTEAMIHAENVGAPLLMEANVAELKASMTPPKVIHLIWVGGVPEKAVNAARLWAEANPDCVIKIHTDRNNLLAGQFRRETAELRGPLGDEGRLGATDQTLATRERMWGHMQSVVHHEDPLHEEPDDLIAEMLDLGNQNHVLTDVRGRYNEAVASISDLPNVEFSDVSELWNVQNYDGIEGVDEELLRDMQMNYQREVTGRCNLAAAVDLLRVLVLMKEPGYYMDVDLRPPMKNDLLDKVEPCRNLLDALRNEGVPDEEIKEVSEALNQIGVLAYEVQSGSLSGNQAKQLGLGLDLVVVDKMDALLSKAITNGMPVETAQEFMGQLDAAVDAAKQHGIAAEVNDVYDFSGITKGLMVHPDFIRARNVNGYPNNNLLAASQRGSAALVAMVHNMVNFFRQAKLDEPRTDTLRDLDPTTLLEDMTEEEKLATQRHRYFNDGRTRGDFRQMTIGITGPGMISFSVGSSKNAATHMRSLGGVQNFEAVALQKPTESILGDVLLAPKNSFVAYSALAEIGSEWQGRSILFSVITDITNPTGFTTGIGEVSVMAIDDELRPEQKRLVVVDAEGHQHKFSPSNSRLLIEACEMRGIDLSVPQTITLEVDDRLARVDAAGEYLRATAGAPPLRVPVPEVPAAAVGVPVMPNPEAPAPELAPPAPELAPPEPPAAAAHDLDVVLAPHVAAREVELAVLGAEPEVIENAVGTWNPHRPRVVVAELRQPCPPIQRHPCRSLLHDRVHLCRQRQLVRRPPARRLLGRRPRTAGRAVPHRPRS